MCGMLKTFASQLCVTPQSCYSSGFVQPVVVQFHNDCADLIILLQILVFSPCRKASQLRVFFVFFYLLIFFMIVCLYQLFALCCPFSSLHFAVPDVKYGNSVLLK